MSKSQYKRLMVQTSEVDKTKVEVMVNKNTLDSMALMCNKLEVDYDGLIEFLVIFAKGSLVMFKEE